MTILDFDSAFGGVEDLRDAIGELFEDLYRIIDKKPHKPDLEAQRYELVDLIEEIVDERDELKERLRKLEEDTGGEEQ